MVKRWRGANFYPPLSLYSFIYSLFTFLYALFSPKKIFMKKHTITAALPYANGPLHLGHLAGAYLPADIYARFLRAQGKDVLFVCGSDEHGAAITVRAKKDNRTPKDIVDEYHQLNKQTFEKLGISFDVYHRTSEALHHETALDFFKTLVDKGEDFDVLPSEQYFDEAANQFLADRFIVGTCPVCGHHEAYGDQCENCGSSLSPDELIEPRSTLSGATPVKRPTKHWYFKLDKHGEWLRTWLEKGEVDGKVLHNPNDWKNHVLGQCLSWLDNLQPRAITRDLDWGIPIEGVVGEDGAGKVLYVWFDAPIGYISATKHWAQANGKNWEDYWKGDNVELVHFIGKDNIVFHCIIFPSMLHAHGGYTLPVNVPANQFLNFEGRKFSKSKNWGVEQHQYLEDFAAFANKEDALRYYMVKAMPETKDGDFKWDEFEEAHDNELVANLGNFINRVLVLNHKYFGGAIPTIDPTVDIKRLSATENASVKACRDSIAAFLTQVESNIERYEFKNAMKSVMELSTFGNGILQFNEPWTVAKNDPDSPIVANTLALALEVVAALSVVIEPFLPFTAPKIRQFLNLPTLQSGDFTTTLTTLQKGESLFPAGHQIGQAELLFAKINDPKDPTRKNLIDAERSKLKGILEQLAATEKAAEKAKEATKKETTPTMEATESALISYDDFAKLDLRTAVITAAERIPKADKLLKITLSLGDETRTVCSGIALQFAPEDIVGQEVLYLANLAPRVMRGVESSGMILMAENAEGQLSFVNAKGFGVGLKVK